MTSDFSDRLHSKTYEGIIDLAVKNNSHTKIIDLIIEDSSGKTSRILEVGCASGYLGEVLRHHGHEVWGIEVSSTAAASAKDKLNHVYEGTIESFLSSGRSQGLTFDYLIFGDVLEHLPDPADVLRRCKELCGQSGKMVASIPNVAHLAVRMMLLEGRWTYHREGILDNTHLRFFTRSSIVDLFSQEGFEIMSMDAVTLPLEDVDSRYDMKINKELLGIAQQIVTDDDQDVFQYVLLARPSVGVESSKENKRFLAESQIRVLCLLPVVDWSLSQVRIQNPLSVWQRTHGGILKIKQMEDYEDNDLLWADVVILQREANDSVLSLIQKVRSLGKPILFDIDDLLTDMPSFLLGYTNNREKNLPFLEKVLRRVDAITVPTARLQRKMQDYNQCVHVVPNCTYSPLRSVTHVNEENEPITLLLASNDTVKTEFIVSALNQVLNESNPSVRIIGVGGPVAESLKKQSVVLEQREAMPYDEFKSFLSSLQNAVGIIPLDDSEFSACKSPIKFVDYSLAGIPSICSAVPPYSDVIEDTVTGCLVENTEESWRRAIKRLATSAELRERIASAAQEFCRKTYGQDVSAAAWAQVFARFRKERSTKEREAHQIEKEAELRRRISDLEHKLNQAGLELGVTRNSWSFRVGRIIVGPASLAKALVGRIRSKR